MTTEVELIAGLREKNENAIYRVYREYYGPVESYVVMNSGSIADAEDVFQDTVLVLIAAVEKAGFILTCPLRAFVFAIARRLWLKQLRNRSRRDTLADIEREQTDFITSWEEVEKSEQRYNSLPEILKRVSTHCSGLLKDLFLTGSIPEHYKNNHSMRNQKYKCLEQARKIAVKINSAEGDICKTLE